MSQSRDYSVAGEMKHPLFGRSTDRILPQAMIGLLVCLAGCGDPIYDSVTFSPAPIDLVLASSEDRSRYEWPQTRDGNS